MKRLLNQKGVTGYQTASGFVSLSVLAVGVLVIASFTLPLIANRLSQRQITQEKAAGSDKCSGIKYKLYIKEGNVAISNLLAVPINTPLLLVMDRNEAKNCQSNWDNVILILDTIDTIGEYHFQKSLPMQFPGGTKYNADFAIGAADRYAVRLYVNNEQCRCNELKFTVTGASAPTATSTPAAVSITNQGSVEFTRTAGTNNYVINAKFGGKYGAGAGRIWLAKKDGTDLDQGKIIKAGGNVLPAKIYSGKTYFLLNTVTLTQRDCNDCFLGNVIAEIPDGEYNLYCDIQGAAGKCSGNPFCQYYGGLVDCAGWNKCSETNLDHRAVITSVSECACPASKPEKAKGNANCDGTIDSADLVVWREEFLGVTTTKTADFNCDDNVDGIDFEIWRRNRN